MRSAGARAFPQRLEHHLRASRFVVGVPARGRKLVDLCVSKPALLEPVARASGEHEETRSPGNVRLVLDRFEQHVATAGVAIAFVDREAGELGHARLGIREEGGAADHRAVPLHHDVVVDLALQVLAGARREPAFSLQGGDELQDAADVGEGGPAGGVIGVRAHHGADAVAGEQLQEQRSVGPAIQQVDALDAVAARVHRRSEERGGVGALEAGLTSPLEQGPCFDQGQLPHRRLRGVAKRCILAQVHELRRSQVGGHIAGDLLRTQVEDLAGGGIAERRDEHDGVPVEVSANRFGVDPAQLSRVLEIDSVADPERAGDEEVPGAHADSRSRHRRVGKTHRQQGLHSGACRRICFYHTSERPRAGDAHSVREGGLEARFREAGIDLRPGAVHQHQPDAEGIEEREVVDERGKGAAFDRFAAEMHHEGSTPVRVDVGGRVAKPLHESARILERSGHAARVINQKGAKLYATTKDRHRWICRISTSPLAAMSHRFSVALGAKMP